MTPLEIMDNLAVLIPEHAQFFRTKQLKPDYSKIGSDGRTRQSHFARPTIAGHSSRTNRAYYTSLLINPIIYHPVEKVRQLKKDSKSYKAYGPLPHLPSSYVPYLRPQVIAELQESIRYLSDKVQYMTTAQIQTLQLKQIVILAMELLDTGKNIELSPKQILEIMKRYPKLFRLLRAPTHDEALVNVLLTEINDRKFPITYIPIDIVSKIPSEQLSLPFVQTLKKRSYRHFLAISPEQIDGMELNLRQYIVTERWKSVLRNPENRIRFRNLSVESIKQMDANDRQEILNSMNLSEELFINNLDES